MTTSLITGASSGIGAAFAEAMASRRNELILVARSQDKLETMAEKLQKQYGVRIEILVQDLTENNAGETVFNFVQSQGMTVDILVNNAGFGDYGLFSDRPRHKQLEMIQLNILALTDLTHQFLPGMIERRNGYIINLASIAAFQPIPYIAVYAATKAFVLSFSESLWAEVKPFGVKVLALCPGVTKTNFQVVAEFPDTLDSQATSGIMTAEAVVKEAMVALELDQPNLVNGGPLNQFIVNFSRFLPRPTLVKILEQQFRPPLTSS